MAIWMLVGMPTPPVGDRWCYRCAGRYKAAVLEAAEVTPEWFEANVNQGPDEKIVTTGFPVKNPVAALPPLELAVVDTGECWSHLQALPAVPTVPPGFRRSGLIPGAS